MNVASIILAIFEDNSRLNQGFQMIAVAIFFMNKLTLLCHIKKNTFSKSIETKKVLPLRVEKRL
jgi:hypothetical protein